MTNYTAGSETSPSSEAPTSSFNPLQILSRRWPFLAAGLVIGAIVGVLIHMTTPPQYQSGAQVLVVKKRSEMSKDGDIRVATVEDYVATQVTLIKSEKIRMAAVQKARELPNTSDLPADDYSLAAMIGAGLTVGRDKEAGATFVGSGVLNLTFRGGNPEQCKRLLEAVILAHRTELYNIYEKSGQEQIASLKKLIETLQEQSRNAQQEYNAKKFELDEKTKNEEVVRIRSRVSAARDQMLTLDLEVTDVENQLKLVRETGADPQERHNMLSQLTARFRPLTPGIAVQTPTIPATLAPAASEHFGLKAVLKGLEKQRRDLTTTVGLGKDHPRVQAIDTQIAELKAEMALTPATPMNEKPGQPLPDELTQYGRWLEQRKFTIGQQKKVISNQMEADQMLLNSAGGLQDRIDALASQMQKLNLEIAKHSADQLSIITTKGGSGYDAEQITPPGYGSKVGPVWIRSMITGLGLGVLLGILVMVLAEVSDKSFRSPEELRKRLGLPIIGHIPQIRNDLQPTAVVPEEVDPILVVASRPKSSEAEAYRGLRTQLFFSTQGRGHQVIQVTSPSPGDGKSTLAANLAISIAQSGKRTLLIDADLRKPRVHKLFGVASEHGLAGVITGTDPAAEAIIPSGLDHLDILPCGTRPANPAELLGSPQFLETLTELRARYDFVILDTPPLLAVTDPAVVAPRVDGVMLVFQMTKKVRPAAERAREVLAGVGANTLGVIVNAVAQRAQGYGYTYGYSDGYSYGYEYSDYSYSDDYTDEPHEHNVAVPRKG